MYKHRLVSALLALLIMLSSSGLTVTSLAVSNEFPATYDPNMSIEEKWAWIQSNNIEPTFSGNAERVARSYSYVTSTYTFYTGPTTADDPDTPYLNIGSLSTRVAFTINDARTAVTDWSNYYCEAEVLPNFDLGLEPEVTVQGYNPLPSNARVNYTAWYICTHGNFYIDVIYNINSNGDYDAYPIIGGPYDDNTTHPENPDP